ncbi:MAG: phosphoglycerate mutase family protein [Planctomycetota bacterium]
MIAPKLLLIRHAKANPESPTGLDVDRALAPRGERQASWLAEVLAGDEAWRPERILSSPATRCQQTAEAIAEACTLDVETTDALALSSWAGRIVDLADELAEHADHQNGPPGVRVALVSHQPHLASVIAALSAGPTAELPRVRTGECFALERAGTAPCWALRAAFRAPD